MRFRPLTFIALLISLATETTASKNKFDIKPTQTADGKTAYDFQGTLTREQMKGMVKMAKTAGKFYSVYKNTKDAPKSSEEEADQSEGKKQSSVVQKTSTVKRTRVTDFDHDDDFDSFGPGSFEKNVRVKYTRTVHV
jgi:hypothetical protein